MLALNSGICLSAEKITKIGEVIMRDESFPLARIQIINFNTSTFSRRVFKNKTPTFGNEQIDLLCDFVRDLNKTSLGHKLRLILS